MDYPFSNKFKYGDRSDMARFFFACNTRKQEIEIRGHKNNLKMGEQYHMEDAIMVYWLEH